MWRTNSPDCVSIQVISTAPRSGISGVTTRDSRSRTSLRREGIFGISGWRMQKRALRCGEAKSRSAQADHEGKEILDRGHIPDQEQFFPYLEGYVAFYSRDYRAALEALESRIGERSVHRMSARTDLRSPRRPRAIGRALYHRAAAVTAHSVPAAYAQPLAKENLRPGMRAGSNAGADRITSPVAAGRRRVASARMASSL